MSPKKKRVSRKPIVTLAEVRGAVADYMRSEGCGCCGNREAHEAATARLGQLLGVPMYDDKSGYDFGRFETERSR